jgi:RepB DNA-primase from phage plasmid
VFDSSSPGTPKISPELIRAHAEIIHRLAAPLAGKGKLVIAAFGEDPDRPNPKTGAPGYPLPPLIRHVGIGDVEKTVSVICDLSSRRHYNVYMPLAVFRLDLPAGRKGTEEDVVAVLGNVADFDDPDAARWSERLPLPASCALETSAGRFQAFIFFDQPEAFVTVKPVAGRLKAFSRCDNGTIDTCHVWRIPGTLNWPNAKKVGEGRPREPQTVRVVKPWRGDRTSLIDLAAALPEPRSEPETGERGDEEAEADQGANTDTNGAGSDDVSIALVLKVLSAKLRARITEPAPTGNRSDRLYHVIRALIDLQFGNSLHWCPVERL